MTKIEKVITPQSKKGKKKSKTTKHQTLQKSIPKHPNDFLCVTIRVQR
jgi:hypothetical protein